MPADLAEVGLADPLPVARAWLHLDNGALIATFVDPIASQTLAVAPWLQAGVFRWVCGHAPIPVDAVLQSSATSAAQTSVPEAWLPEACRSNPSTQRLISDVMYGMSAARTGIYETYMLQGVVPATLAELGLPDPQPIAQARLQIVGGVLVATFAGALEGKSFALAPWALNGDMVWVCGHRTPPAGATPIASSSASEHTTLDTTLLPEGCR